MYRPQDRLSNAEMASTITRCVTGARSERQDARRTLLKALRADGYTLGQSKVMCDRLLSEARQAKENAVVIFRGSRGGGKTAALFDPK